MTLPEASSCPCCSAFQSRIPAWGRCPGSVSQLGSACRLVGPSPGCGRWVFWAPALTHTGLWTCGHVSLRGLCHHFSPIKPGSPVDGGCPAPAVAVPESGLCKLLLRVLPGTFWASWVSSCWRGRAGLASVVRVAVYSACTLDKPDVRCLACKSTVRCFTHPGTCF